MPTSNSVIATRLQFVAKWFAFLFTVIIISSVTFAYLYSHHHWSFLINGTVASAVILTMSILFAQTWFHELDGFKEIGKLKLNIFSVLFSICGILLIYLQEFYLKVGISVSEAAFHPILPLQVETEFKIIALTFFTTLFLSLYLLFSKAADQSIKDKLIFIALLTVFLFIIAFFITFTFYTIVTLFGSTVISYLYNFSTHFRQKTVVDESEIKSAIRNLLNTFCQVHLIKTNILSLVFVLTPLIVTPLLIGFGIYFTSWWSVLGNILLGFIFGNLISELSGLPLIEGARDSFLALFSHNRDYYEKAVNILETIEMPKTPNKLVQNQFRMLHVRLFQAVSKNRPVFKETDNTSPFDIRRVDSTSATTDSENQIQTGLPENISREILKELENIVTAILPKKEPLKAGLLERLTEKEAVQLAYKNEIQNIASVLKVGLSALVSCDKLVVEHLWQEIVKVAKLKYQVLQVSDISTVQSSLLQGQLTLLRKQVESLKKGQVLVVPHLDLLAGGSPGYPTDAAREFTELVYRASDSCILAFTDVSLEIPEIIAARFSIRKTISGVPRTITLSNGSEVLLGQVFVTANELKQIKNFDPEGLYKSISGMNPVQIRHAITYAIQELTTKEPMSMEQLYQAIRSFKAKISANFEIPDVRFEDIGGYENVKAQLLEAIYLLEGTYQLPNEKLRRELIPRGFIFHGKPGTGKTLFAKAVANRLNATVMVVSGPETLDKWLGESERKVRELFAEARRNAPSVLIFDEFDAIASKRSSDTGSGSRAINSMVAQILTEMDGFRPDVPMLIIGTTNRIDIIDEAFLRPSRFQAIAIDLPDKVARYAIAKIYAQHFEMTVSEELLEVIAVSTVGFNGDEIRAIFRDAYVGICKNPPISANAYHFGELVGLIRRSKKEQQGYSFRIA